MLSAHFNEPVILPQFFSLVFTSFLILACCERHAFGRPRGHRDFKGYYPAVVKIHRLPFLKYSNITFSSFNGLKVLYICVLREKLQLVMGFQ